MCAEIRSAHARHVVGTPLFIREEETHRRPGHARPASRHAWCSARLSDTRRSFREPHHPRIAASVRSDGRRVPRTPPKSHFVSGSSRDRGVTGCSAAGVPDRRPGRRKSRPASRPPHRAERTSRASWARPARHGRSRGPGGFLPVGRDLSMMGAPGSWASVSTSTSRQNRSTRCSGKMQSRHLRQEDRPRTVGRSGAGRWCTHVPRRSCRGSADRYWQLSRSAVSRGGDQHRATMPSDWAGGLGGEANRSRWRIGVSVDVP